MSNEDYKIAYENVMTANKMLEKELDKFRPFTSAYEMKKEIERLNNIINLRREEHNIIHTTMNIYKSRNEKAINYIEKQTKKLYKNWDIENFDFEELLNILKGVDK